MRYLVIDDRSGSPRYVFLRSDPTGEDGYPGLPVFPVTLDRPPVPTGDGAVVGRHFGFPNYFREFRDGRGAADAPFSLVEPSYIGTTWRAYVEDLRAGAC